MTEQAQEADTDTDTDAADGGSDDVTFAFEATDELIDAIVDPLQACNHGASTPCAIFEFVPEGVEAHVVDPAKVLMSHVEAPADAFDSYDSGTLKTGFHLDRFADFATTADTASVRWNTAEGVLDIVSGPVDSTMTGMEPDTIPTKKPTEKTFNGTDATWRMRGDDLSTALKATSKLGGAVADFHVVPGEGVFLQKSGDTKNRVRAEFDTAKFDVEPDEAFTCMQSEDYLGKIDRAVPDGDTELTLQTADGWPIIVQWSHEGVDVTLTQAPRLPTDR